MPVAWPRWGVRGFTIGRPLRDRGRKPRRTAISRYAVGHSRTYTCATYPSSATIGADVELGAGSVICSNVSLTTNIRLGRHVHVNLNSTIGHDSRIADFVTINPLVAVSGDVCLDEDVTMGTHSSILQGLHVGTRSFVGAGAVVTKDVAPGTTVVGVPAKPLP